MAKKSSHRITQNSYREIIDRCLEDREFRIATVTESHFWFFHVYFGDIAIRYETAAFQKEILALTEDSKPSILAIAAFRGSAKSTICTLSLPLWAIFGKLKKKYVLIVGRTQEQVKHFMGDINAQIEYNELLKKDLGPFQFKEDDQRRFFLELDEYRAKILGVTSQQSIRGLKYQSRRPDLLICDDIEDLDSVQTKESRDMTFRWVREELIPAGDIGTRMVFVGNLLHGACLLKRMQREIARGTFDGIYREYPLLDAQGKCLWPGKFPTEAAIEEERRRVGDERAWEREYLLKVLPDADRIIRPEWIRSYHRIGESGEIYLYTATGIDFAFSPGADNRTAMVTAKVFEKNRQLKVYILPNPVNEPLSSLDAPKRAREIAAATRRDEMVRFPPPARKPHPRITLPTREEEQKEEKSRLFIDDGEYQSMIMKHLGDQRCEVTEVKLPNEDKRARLSFASSLLQSGQVFFPKQGCEELIAQLMNYGIDEYDDLADAFAILLFRIKEEGVDTIIQIAGDEIRWPGRWRLGENRKNH